MEVMYGEAPVMLSRHAIEYDNILAFRAGIWHTNRVAPFSLAGSFPRVPPSRVTCLVNGAKERSQEFNEVAVV